MSQPNRELEAAWQWRANRGLIKAQGSLRVFHGSGDGTHELKNVSIDRFEEPSGRAHYWVTQWEASGKPAPLEGIRDFLRERGAESAVALLRPEKGVPSEPRVILGVPPDSKFIAREGRALFKIRFIGSKHPGLFLDHFPLRRWLGESARDLKVLNTFSYTGSLSIAAGLGGASQVTTLDLSQPTILWAEENWALNGLATEKARFIYGDYFEWLPRLKRENKKFDLAILDPPSFSRSKNGTFSTSKDLRKLHALAFAVLKPESFLVTSINSANIAWDEYAEELLGASSDAGVSLQVLSRIDLPETFPTKLENDLDRYLKGWILRISSGKGASHFKRS